MGRIARCKTNHPSFPYKLNEVLAAVGSVVDPQSPYYVTDKQLTALFRNASVNLFGGASELAARPAMDASVEGMEEAVAATSEDGQVYIRGVRGEGTASTVAAPSSDPTPVAAAGAGDADVDTATAADASAGSSTADVGASVGAGAASVPS
jgi:hypothetical protein